MITALLFAAAACSLADLLLNVYRWRKHERRLAEMVRHQREIEMATGMQSAGVTPIRLSK